MGATLRWLAPLLYYLVGHFPNGPRDPRSRERRRMATNGAAQNAAGQRQDSTLGSIDHDSEGIVESIRCRRCGGTGLYPSKYLEEAFSEVVR